MPRFTYHCPECAAEIEVEVSAGRRGDYYNPPEPPECEHDEECPGCGHTIDPLDVQAEMPDFERLKEDERADMAMEKAKEERIEQRWRESHK